MWEGLSHPVIWWVMRAVSIFLVLGMAITPWTVGAWIVFSDLGTLGYLGALFVSLSVAGSGVAGAYRQRVYPGLLLRRRIAEDRSKVPPSYYDPYEYRKYLAERIVRVNRDG